MSPPDTMARQLSTRWLDLVGDPLPVRPLPGLAPDVIQGFAALYPDIVNSDVSRLLQTSCGLTGTVLGDIDFTGQWHSEEPLSIFTPCVTLAIDAGGRRWIAEAPGGAGLPGPVWCIFREPEVTLHVSEDLAQFISTLYVRTRHRRMPEWLQGLSAQARDVWSHRHRLGARFRHSARRDHDLHTWACSLPFDTYIYDLRLPGVARGWPHGMASSTGRIYRCGRLPVFAVAQSPVRHSDISALGATAAT